MLINTQGIILRETKFQEADKILTIFTRKNGKLQAIAKGARRPKSQLIASTQVFCFSDFVLYKGKNMYNISQGEVVNSFYSLREDLNKLANATYIIELVNAGITEEEPNEILFRLILKTLTVLSFMEEDYAKLVRAFELKYISFLGYKPQLELCVMCHNEPGDKMKFSIEHGGIICEKCIHKDIFGEAMDKEALKTMKLLLYSELDKLHKLTISRHILQRIENILIKYIMVHTDKKIFKSLNFLKAIQKNNGGV